MKVTQFQHEYLEKILATEDEHLLKLHQLVADAMREQELISEKLLHPPREVLSRGQLVADKVASLGGSWTFIISFGVVLFSWIAVNIILATRAFDPFPFILLNLVLSCLAALVLFVHLRNDFQNLLFKYWHMHLDDPPKNIILNLVIIMYENMPQTRNCLPLNFRIFFF
ncbi:MAG: DUF1003 domain-containing protein [Phaeodactylibacter sp.]|nr:DUF1003 domain-containing protein [Phaeodactylibacter sp.]